MGDMARFFYCAKASKADRDEGLESGHNFHSTVKPIDLMRYLCRLITPPRGVILDPFMGSGSTGKAAMLEGFGFIGIELNPAYVDVAIKRWQDFTGKTAVHAETGDTFNDLVAARKTTEDA